MTDRSTLEAANRYNGPKCPMLRALGHKDLIFPSITYPNDWDNEEITFFTLSGDRNVRTTFKLDASAGLVRNIGQQNEILAI